VLGCPSGYECTEDDRCEEAGEEPEPTPIPPPTPTPSPTPPPSPTPTPSPTPPPEPTESEAAPTFPSFPASSSTTSSAPSCTPTSGSGDYIFIDGSCLPVMDFYSVSGLTDELCESMCAGMGGTNTVVLTWAGDGASGANQRRSQSGCRGYCTGKQISLRVQPVVGDFGNLTWGPSPKAKQTRRGRACNATSSPLVGSTPLSPESHDNCFDSLTRSGTASTIEGGPNAHKMCITWWQNSIQGSLIRGYAADFDLQPNQKFAVRVLPGCGSSGNSGSKRSLWASPMARVARSDEPTTHATGNETTISSSGGIWKNSPNQTDFAGYVLSPLGGGQAGSYDSVLTVSGGFYSLSILDGDGIDYFRSVCPSGIPAAASPSRRVASSTLFRSPAHMHANRQN
jgi:hypothetical protein